MPDIIPPGNTPAPNAGDDPRTFPDFWQSDLWPALWPRQVLSYPNAAARDADLAGLGPTSTAYAYLQDTKQVTYWTGAAWGYLTPQSAARVGKRIHWNTFTSTDASRADATGLHLNIAHGCGFTPSVCIITPQNLALQFRAFNFTATSFDIGVINSDGTANGTSTFTFSAMFGE